MSDVREHDLITYDPLGEVTRRERKALLGMAMLGLALVKVPLVPAKFAAFGIEFSELNRQNFASMYALVVTYFLIAFVVYAFSDFVAWQRSEVIRYAAYVQAQLKEPSLSPSRSSSPLLGESGKPLHPAIPDPSPAYRGFASWASAVAASRLRAVFEFVVPVVFAAYVLCQLLAYAG